MDKICNSFVSIHHQHQQPDHLLDDADSVAKKLGNERAVKESYLFKSLLESNALVALGSDWPVSIFELLVHLYLALYYYTSVMNWDLMFLFVIPCIYECFNLYKQLQQITIINENKSVSDLCRLPILGTN